MTIGGLARGQARENATSVAGVIFNSLGWFERETRVLEKEHFSRALFATSYSARPVLSLQTFPEP